MKTTRRRYWVFFLLFLFNLIAYVDRVNMSVAGKPIAQEFGLSPVALGYLFSSFLWAYVLMMLPGGRLIDRWGAHVMASIATAVWSAAQMATGAASSFATMLGARPSNSQQAEVLEFYCRMAHQAGAIQQFRPVECIILSSSELLGRAPREFLACEVHKRLVRRIEEGALGSQASASLRVVLRENQVAWSAYDAPLG